MENEPRPSTLYGQQFWISFIGGLLGSIIGALIGILLIILAALDIIYHIP